MPSINQNIEANDTIESRMLLCHVFEQKKDYLTKLPSERPKIDYLDRVHFLPDTPVLYGAKKMHGLKDSYAAGTLHDKNLLKDTYSGLKPETYSSSSALSRPSLYVSSAPLLYRSGNSSSTLLYQ